MHDNEALLAALKGAQKVFPVFVLDPHFAKPEFVGVVRYNFLLKSLADLDSTLRALGSRLYILRGKPMQQLQAQIKVEPRIHSCMVFLLLLLDLFGMACLVVDMARLLVALPH